MFRSVARYAGRIGHSIRQKEPGLGRSKTGPELVKVPQLQATSLRHISLSTARCEDQRKRRPRRDKAQANDQDPSPVSPEMKEAAVQAAKSLPGNWTKTAEELLARLQVKRESDGADGAEGTDVPKEGARSLLSTMKVGRSFDTGARPDRRKTGRRSPRESRDDDIFSQSIVQKASGERGPPRERRRAPVFKDLYGMPRLGIFQAKKQSDVSQDTAEAEGSEDLWAQVEKEHVRRLQGGLPRNAFEETILLTEQGKAWVFPVDNEADLHEERKYKFHDHVFLERHLSAFPASGPVRKFMELVTLGLSQNPWLSVPEKLEHIAWFEQYFREKQDVLDTTLGEQGKMREVE